MNSIQTNLSSATNYGSLGFQNGNLAQSVEEALGSKSRSLSNLSGLYLVTDNKSVAIRNADMTARSINDATSLVQSIDASASVIESKLVDMKAMAMSESGCGCGVMRRAQESITEIANNSSWNGVNYMVGGGQNDQNTTLLSLSVKTGGGPESNLQMTFKSFNPMSAVDTNGELAPKTPNLPDLNKSAGTDTHVYGDAAMYAGLDDKLHLHTHTADMKAHTIIQLGRAIDGVSAERERLAGYLKQLSSIAEKSNTEKTDSANSLGQEIMNSDYAYRIAKMIEVEMLNESASINSIHKSPNQSKMNVLLN